MKLGFIIKSLFLISSSFLLHCSETRCELPIIFELDSTYYRSSRKIFQNEKTIDAVVFDLNEVFKDFLTPEKNIKFLNVQMSGEFNADLIKGKKLKFPKCYLVRNPGMFLSKITANDKVDFSSLEQLTNSSFDGTRVTIKKNIVLTENVVIFFTLEIENSDDKVGESGCSCRKVGEKSRRE